MIPFLLAAVGGYLIGDSVKDDVKFADGGVMARGGTSKSKEELLKEWIESIKDKTITTQVGQPIYKMRDAWNNSSVPERKEMVKKLGRNFDVDYNLKYNEIPVGLQVFLEKKYLKTYMDLSGKNKENKTFADGGKTNWIQEATKNNKGALRRTAKREGLIKGDEKLSMTDIKKLEKMGGKTSKRAHLAETLKKIKK
jgi:hypothetical protein